MGRLQQPVGAVVAVVLVVGAALLGGCSDCHESTDEMRAFVLARENQHCQSDVDCVAASVGCADLDLAFCG